MSTVPTSPVADSNAERVAGELVDCTSPAWVDFGASWGSLSDDQFMAAMRLVLAEEPHKVAAAWAGVQKRLAGHTDLLEQLLDETAAQVKSVDRLAVIELTSAPLDILLAVVRGLDNLPAYPMRAEGWWNQEVPAVELLVSVLYRLSVATADDLLEELMPKFAEVHPVLLYRAVRRGMRVQRKSGGGNQDMDDFLLLVAGDWLSQAGYEIGVVRMDRHRGEMQPSVLKFEDGVKLRFVPFKHGFDYFPTDGAEVIFRPQQGRLLVAQTRLRVAAVSFIPVL